MIGKDTGLDPFASPVHQADRPSRKNHDIGTKLRSQLLQLLREQEAVKFIQQLQGRRCVRTTTQTSPMGIFFSRRMAYAASIEAPG
jgi:hypothetical protein